MKLWRILLTALACCLLVLVLFQRGAINDLERKVAALSPPEQDEEAPAAAPASDARLERRIAALEQTVARVFRMLLGGNRPDARPAGDDKGAPAATRAEVNNLREDVDSLLTGEALNTDKGREQLHQIVRQVQQEQRQQRRQRWRQVRDAMRRERLDKLAKQSGLNANQTEQLGNLLDGEQTQRRALMRAARDGNKAPAEAFKEVRALRQATDDKARSLLDDKQYEAYQQMRQERGRRRGWR